jgi:hypothetical protein
MLAADDAKVSVTKARRMFRATNVLPLTCALILGAACPAQTRPVPNMTLILWDDASLQQIADTSLMIEAIDDESRRIRTHLDEAGDAERTALLQRQERLRAQRKDAQDDLDYIRLEEGWGEVLPDGTVSWYARETHLDPHMEAVAAMLESDKTDVEKAQAELAATLHGVAQDRKTQLLAVQCCDDAIQRAVTYGCMGYWKDLMRPAVRRMSDEQLLVRFEGEQAGAAMRANFVEVRLDLHKARAFPKSKADWERVDRLLKYLALRWPAEREEFVRRGFLSFAGFQMQLLASPVTRATDELTEPERARMMKVIEDGLLVLGGKELTARRWQYWGKTAEKALSLSPCSSLRSFCDKQADRIPEQVRQGLKKRLAAAPP